MTDDADRELFRSRLWINGKLVDETWLTANNSSAVGRRQVQMVEAAGEEAKWMLELYDPDTDGCERFGNDTAGMVDPQPTTLAEIAADGHRRISEKGGL